MIKQNNVLLDKTVQNKDSAGAKDNPFPIQTYMGRENNNTHVSGMKSESERIAERRAELGLVPKPEEEPARPVHFENPVEKSTDTSTSTDTNSNSLSFESIEDLLDYVNSLNLGTQTTEAHDIYKGNSEKFMTGIDDFLAWMKTNANTAFAEALRNPLETDWGKGILDYYGVLGDNSANAVNADTAAENGGNIDSYAAANAERQRLSKLGQGVSTVYGMNAERVNNMLSVLNSIGVNTNELFGTMGEYGVNTAADYANSLYATDADLTKSTNELMAAIEAGTTPVINLSDNAVAAQLMSAYKDLDVQGGGDGEIDWTATDTETWEAVKKALKDNPAFENLNDTYLDALIAQIIKNKGGWDWAKDILKTDAGA